MGNKALIYLEKMVSNLDESKLHLLRLNSGFNELEKKYAFPLKIFDIKNIINDVQDLAFCDQCIYRFSKLQDCMGAKLFKSVLLFQGENINKPFIDILNRLEKIDIIKVDDWFEIRDLRNEIAHEYDENDETVMEILNSIYKIRNDLSNTLISIEKMIKSHEI